MNALPFILGALLVMAIAYRYYSAFLAAKVVALDDARITPAHALNDGQNYHPTNKWVLFGHHFAAISGAGPLIGPVLAAQFGFLPGFLWLLIGVCLGGALGTKFRAVLLPPLLLLAAWPSLPDDARRARRYARLAGARG